jgi:hypothetical protein
LSLNACMSTSTRATSPPWTRSSSYTPRRRAPASSPRSCT